jgi:hypothetical protein
MLDPCCQPWEVEGWEWAAAERAVKERGVKVMAVMVREAGVMGEMDMAAAVMAERVMAVEVTGGMAEGVVTTGDLDPLDPRESAQRADRTYQAAKAPTTKVGVVNKTSNTDSIKHAPLVPGSSLDARCGSSATRLAWQPAHEYPKLRVMPAWGHALVNTSVEALTMQ